MTTPTVEILETCVSGKKLYAVIKGDIATIRCDCELYEMAKFDIPRAAAREIFNGFRLRKIRDILPYHDKRVHEVFLSGMTPAEFDRAFDREVLEPEEYGCYPKRPLRVTTPKTYLPNPHLKDNQ